MNWEGWDEGKITLAKHGLLAVMGGLVRELVKGGQHSLIKFVCGAFIALFIGFLISFACEYKEINPSLTKVFIMLGSYSGVPLLDLISSQFRKGIRKVCEPETETKTKP